MLVMKSNDRFMRRLDMSDGCVARDHYRDLGTENERSDPYIVGFLPRVVIHIVVIAFGFGELSFRPFYYNIYRLL